MEISTELCGRYISGHDDISNVWRQHFEKVFNCIQDNDVNTRMINAEYSADIIVTSDEVAMAIRKLSTGKSSGLDGIGLYAEHLLHCTQLLVTTPSMCFTGLFVHVFLPGNMHEIVPVAVIKDKTDKIDHLTRLPSKEHLRWQQTRKLLGYRESTHAIISVTCPYYMCTPP